MSCLSAFWEDGTLEYSISLKTSYLLSFDVLKLPGIVAIRIVIPIDEDVTREVGNSF